MKILNIINAVILTFLLWSSAIFANDSMKQSIRFSGIPGVKFDSDNGFGGGLIGNMYVDQYGYSPYRISVGAKALVTTKSVHSHAVTFDYLGAFSTELRLLSRVGVYSTLAQTFCGVGALANCDEEQAKAEAGRSGLMGTEKDRFINQFYKNRYVSVFGELFARWPLWKNGFRLDVMGSYRGRYYYEGDFKHRGPYKNSYFDQMFKDSKTDGYLSTLELGLMIDSRDNEPAPTSGYWVESSIRGGAPFLGSTWEYLGGNLSARFYLPIDNEHNFVVATQSIIDAIGGDLPFDAMSRTGGSSSFDDQTAVGGQNIGRGIREQYFVGKFKAIQQLELRYKFWSFELLKQNFDLTAASFGDFAAVAWDYKKFSQEMSKIHAGFGGGLRINWNKTFVVRLDVGVSPEENFAPKFYIVMGNVF